MAMMPKLQMSTFGPYAFRVTTSGAIQYGVPTMVVRLACVGSDICAQKPKSAVGRVRKRLADGQALTQFDIALHAQQNIVALNVTVNDTVPM
jgi:hypothetical protein